MYILVIGVFTALNFIFIKWKISKGRYSDATLDIGAFIALNWMFGGTMSGMSIAMVASAIFSVYLYYSPPSWSIEEDTVEKSS